MAAAPAPAEPQRRLGWPSAAALVVANMIGAGVFTTSGLALADLGHPAVVLLAWVVGGVIAMCGALSYGALARCIPESGGEYTFLSRTVHPAAGVVAGWVSLLAGFTAPIAAAAHGLEAYLGNPFGPGTPWAGTIAIIAAGLAHGVRLGAGVAAQNAAVALKLLLMVAFVAAGGVHLAAVGVLAAGTGHVDVAAFAMSVVWVSFSYSGWNAAVYVAGEVRDPDRNLGRALVGSTALVTIVYLGLNTVFLYGAPAAAIAGRTDVGAIAAAAIGGPVLERAVAYLVALALLTGISSMVMAGPRVYARMAADGVLPAVFARGRDVPAAAVWLQVALAVTVLWVSRLADLFGYIGFTLGLCAAATVLGLLRLRREWGATRVPIPGYPWVPLTFVVLTVLSSGLLMLRQPIEAGLGLATAVAGLPLYWLTRRDPTVHARFSSGAR